MSAALFHYRRQDCRDTKDLGRFRQANYVVDQQDSIDVLHTRKLKALMVDENHRAVIWIEQVANSDVSVFHGYPSLLLFEVDLRLVHD